MALYDSRYHILFFLVILIVDNASLFLTYLLQDHVLRILCRDAPELFGLDLHMQHVAQLCLVGEFPRILQ